MEDAHAELSWRKWFELHGPKLLLCARQWTRSHADAEDIVQDAFVRFWRGQRQLGGEPLALLLTSIRRAALDRARRESRRSAREDGAAADQPEWFEPAVVEDGRRRAIESALLRLPPEQREVLVLKLWGELTFAEIARQLDVPLNTAASRYRYALGALRQELTAADCHG
ncbi:MAG TPA: sigma-70 family RNA polymerase sigma factor [Opitutus sp.]|nr:sigma-70 family RNA polymerase sigma factor [Opitutus sp.]